MDLLSYLVRLKLLAGGGGAFKTGVGKRIGKKNQKKKKEKESGMACNEQ